MSDIALTPEATAVDAADAASASDEASVWGSLTAQRLGQTDLGRAFTALLRWLHVTPSQRQIDEALPHAEVSFDVTGLRNALLAFGFKTEPRKWKVGMGVPPTPSIWLRENAAAIVLFDANEDTKTVQALDTGSNVTSDVPAKLVRGELLSIASEAADTSPVMVSWLERNVRNHEGHLWLALSLSLVSNVIALVMPMFVMVVYDQVIGSAASGTLYMLVFGVIALLSLDFVVRRLRVATLSQMSANLGYHLGSNAVAKILRLPSRLTERATLSAQVTRIKDIDRVRGPFSASVLQSFMDLPFVVLFAVVIYAMAGLVVLVPLVAIVFLILGGLLYSWAAGRRTNRAGHASSAREALVLEAIDRMRSLRIGATHKRWRERFDAASAQATRHSYSAQMLNTVASTITATVGQVAGLSTIVVGVQLVLDGNLTTGGLIASMILVWRVLGPVQSLVLAFTRIQQANSATKQLHNLMAMPEEASESAVVANAERITGRVEFERVTFRYGGGDPDLMNISLKTEPGDVVAVIGPNGSGKSTILKLIAGLYHAQAGSVRIDGCDIRQYDPQRLRQNIAYVPQKPHLIFTSVAENMRLVVPAATDQELWNALDRAGAANSVRALPNGIDTLWDPRQPQLFPNGLMIRLSLARAYLRAAPITILDEPIGGLDFEGEFQFMEALSELRRFSTVFLVTHRPGHLKVANKVALLDSGMLRYFGAMEDVHDKLTRELM
jgi:ATP-binding cassette, subfamily C, bacterial LapB